ncbi:MAG: FUSC family protein [Bacteroidetes bacterium]|nr:FUSC family protein [Bacteroidota bacterium]MBS1740786.1 FUSC family protein [Bacteroidota bacterium]
MNHPFKQLHTLIQNENFEPLFAWGLRMAITATVPIIWGVSNNRLQDASWITLVAECLCWVELKGSFAQRVRVLVGGAILTFLFTALGSTTSNSLWLSVPAMILVGIISGLFKNLGDRGAGLSVGVLVLFIISNAYQPLDQKAMWERLQLVAIGGAWTTFVGLFASLLTPAQRPYRRSIALIWRATSNLANAVLQGWDGKVARSNIRELYLKEKEVRSMLDNSFHFFETMAHQAKKEDSIRFQLAQLRKVAALVSANIVTISEELEEVRIKEIPTELRTKVHDALRALQQSIERMSAFVVTLKGEEELLIRSRLTRLTRMIVLLKDQKIHFDNTNHSPISRIILLLERSQKLMERGLEQLETMGEDRPVFKSYSLMQTLWVLHPRYLFQNIKMLFNFKSNNARYGLRSALAAGFALFLYKWFHINHGYWLPFTVMIVMQPYFNATWKKAIDRVVGTLTGGLVGGLLIRLPAAMYAKELMLFLCFLFMVYFIRKRYSIAVFFITVSLVLLFDVEESFNPMLIGIRAACTVSGAILAIIAGFTLLPTWDRYSLPTLFAEAVYGNYEYFLATLFVAKRPISWTRNKRNAESKNSNAFDSFTRYTEEPGKSDKKRVIAFFQLLNHNVRITRELTNINLEFEHESYIAEEYTESKETIEKCKEWFEKSLTLLQSLHPELSVLLTSNKNTQQVISGLSKEQQRYASKLLIELKALHGDISTYANMSTQDTY